MLDGGMAAQVRENRRKRPRSDEQPAHHGRGAHGQEHGFLQAVPLHAAPANEAQHADVEPDVERPVGRFFLIEIRAKAQELHADHIEGAQPQAGQGPDCGGLHQGVPRHGLGPEPCQQRHRPGEIPETTGGGEADDHAEARPPGQMALLGHGHAEPRVGQQTEPVIPDIEQEHDQTADPDRFQPIVARVSGVSDPGGGDGSFQNRPQAIARGQHQGSQRPDRRRLRRRRQAEQDGAEDRQDQERQRHEGGEQHIEQVAQRYVRFLLGRFRRQAGVDGRPPHHVDHVKAGQQHAREHGAGIELDHGDTGRRRVDDQHDGRRNENAQTPAGADDSGGKTFVVAGLQHDREGQQPHQGHHGADDADGGGEHGAGQQRRHRQGPGYGAGRDVEAEKQPIDDVGALDHVPDEQEQRHRDQHVVDHHRIGLVDQQVEDPVIEDMVPLVGRGVGVVAEEEGHGDQRETDGKTQQDGEDEEPQHHDGDLGIGHSWRPLALAPNTSAASSCSCWCRRATSSSSTS